VAGPEIDVALLAELLGSHGDEVLERLDLAFDVVGKPAGAVRNPLAFLENDDLETRIVALCFAGC